MIGSKGDAALCTMWNWPLSMQNWRRNSRPRGAFGRRLQSRADLGALAALGCSNERYRNAPNASSCNPDTGKVETFNCTDEAKAIGIVSSGCTKDALKGDSCALDSFSDQACADGTKWFGFCENATTDTQVFNIYVNCFLDN